jgi:hypothetical protein
MMKKPLLLSILAFGLCWNTSAQVRMVLRAPMYFDLQKGDSLSPKSLPGLAFYQGLKLALDSISNQGLDIQLDVLDEEWDGDSVSPIKPWTEVEVILSKQGKMIFVTGKKYGTARIDFNAPMREHLAAISTYLFQVPGKKNLLLLHRNKPQEKKILEVWKDELHVAGFDSTPELVRADLTGYPLEGKLKKGMINYILVPSADQSFVANALNRIQGLADAYSVVVVGLPNWMSFGSIDAEVFEKVQLLYTSEKFVDYQRMDLMRFRKIYQDRYFTDPNDFAYRGFDAGMFWGTLLLKYPNDFDLHLTDPDQERLVNSFELMAENPGKYFNKHVQLLQITPHGISRRNR